MAFEVQWVRVARHTPETLVVEQGAGNNRIIGICCGGAGVVGLLLAWQGEWDGDAPKVVLGALVGTIFAVYGFKILLFDRTNTDRFERGRDTVVIESSGLWGVKKRELPFDRIGDVVIEKVGRGPSYYVYFVTKDGERISWSNTYDGSKENTFECFHAGREFLRLPKAAGETD
jgi:hypothetical protein